MTFIISSMVVVASLLTVVSGVWVIVGLVTELVNPSNRSQASSRADGDSSGEPQKKNKSHQN